MTEGFLVKPDALRWNPLPGTNRPLYVDGDPKKGFLEVESVYPIAAMAGTFHLQLSGRREVIGIEVVNHCPLLRVREKVCAAVSIVQFTTVLDGAWSIESDVRAMPGYLASFQAYGFGFHLFGHGNS